MSSTADFERKCVVQGEEELEKEDLNLKIAR
jgi:hypothetical protein